MRFSKSGILTRSPDLKPARGLAPLRDLTYPGKAAPGGARAGRRGEAMATIYVTDVSATEIEVRFGGCEEDGTCWDGFQVIKPGEELFGLSFEELAHHGVGAVEIEDGA